MITVRAVLYILIILTFKYWTSVISVLVLCTPLYLDLPEDGDLIAETCGRAQADV
jgi:hypothetical protein